MEDTYLKCNRKLEVHEYFDTMKDLKSDILKGIYAHGFQKPSKIQSIIIEPMYSTNKDIIAQAHSGTGKTGAFSIATLQTLDNKLRETQVLVLSPTRELAEQTYNVAIKLSKYTQIVVEKCIGGTFINNNYNIYNNSQIIIGTPGRIFDMTKKKYINYENINYLVLDEADEMLSKEFFEQIKIYSFHLQRL